LTIISHLELALGMELILNLGWVLIAFGMLFAWLRVAPRPAGERRAQFVALAVVILILLPAISMTDDLIAAQNPAEVDCCSARRDHNWSHTHPNFGTPAALQRPVFSGFVDDFREMHVPSDAASPRVVAPFQGPIQNRPPPTA
jgi:hypothetical protein